VAGGPSFNQALGKYTYLFPGADAAVVRTSQRILAHQPGKRVGGQPYLTPQFGASFCVASAFWAMAIAAIGAVFGMLSQYSWGRALLLAYPRAFTLGAFSEEGPSEDTLAKSRFRTVFYGRGWAEASASAPPTGGFDMRVRTSVSGPDPGYGGTALMFAMMARTVIDDRAALQGAVRGGVFTPGGLLGSAGVGVVERAIARMGMVGIHFRVEEGPTTTPPS